MGQLSNSDKLQVLTDKLVKLNPYNYDIVQQAVQETSTTRQAVAELEQFLQSEYKIKSSDIYGFTPSADEYIKRFESDLKQNNFDNIFGKSFYQLKRTQPGAKEIAQEVIDIFINRAGINIFDYLTTVFWSTFADMNLPTKIIGKNIEQICDEGFSKTDIEMAYFPNCKSIGMYAFDSCKKLKSINVESVFEVRSSAFYNCTSLTQLSLLNAENIGIHAFSGCTGLEELYIPKYDLSSATSILRVFDKSHEFSSLKRIYIDFKGTLTKHTMHSEQAKKCFPNLKIIDYKTNNVIKDYTQ